MNIYKLKSKIRFIEESIYKLQATGRTDTVLYMQRCIQLGKYRDWENEVIATLKRKGNR